MESEFLANLILGFFLSVFTLFLLISLLSHHFKESFLSVGLMLMAFYVFKQGFLAGTAALISLISGYLGSIRLASPNSYLAARFYSDELWRESWAKYGPPNDPHWAQRQRQRAKRSYT